jgi:hypothetical protein
MSSSNILAVGQDPMLLKTRSQILRAEGFAVVPILSLSKAIGYPLAGDFDLTCYATLFPCKLGNASSNGYENTLTLPSLRLRRIPASTIHSWTQLLRVIRKA